MDYQGWLAHPSILNNPKSPIPSWIVRLWTTQWQECVLNSEAHSDLEGFSSDDTDSDSTSDEVDVRKHITERPCKRGTPPPGNLVPSVCFLICVLVQSSDSQLIQ